MVTIGDISSKNCFQFCNRTDAICATSSMNDLLAGSKVNENDAVSGGDTSDTDTDETDVSDVSSKGIIESIFDLFGGFLSGGDSDEDNISSLLSNPLIKPRKRVHFDRVVKVILIRNRFEYLQSGLIPQLWFFEEDYTAARLERIQEIKEQRRLDALGKQSQLHADCYCGSNASTSNYGDVIQSSGSSVHSGEDGQTDIEDDCSSCGFDSSNNNSSDYNDYVIEGEVFYCRGEANDDKDDYYVEDLSPEHPVKQDANFVKWNVIKQIEKSFSEDDKNYCKYVEQVQINGDDAKVGGHGNDKSNDSNSNSSDDGNIPGKSSIIRRCQTFRVNSKDNIVIEDDSDRVVDTNLS